MGRPSLYSDQLAEKICEMLASGLSLRAICQEPQFPTEAAVRLWVIEDRSGFSSRYVRARNIGLDCLADRIIELAETAVIGEKRVQKADGGIEITTGDCVDRSRLAVDAAKWYLSKVAPKRYGERLELAGDQKAPLTIKIVREDRT